MSKLVSEIRSKVRAEELAAAVQEQAAEQMREIAETADARVAAEDDEDARMLVFALRHDLDQQLWKATACGFAESGGSPISVGALPISVGASLRTFPFQKCVSQVTISLRVLEFGRWVFMSVNGAPSTRSC